MDDFFSYFGLGLSVGFAAALSFYMVGRTIRRAFGLIGRGVLMR